ncbi:TPA: hypothetical protein KEY68_000648 [Providencia rettgeri]|nr:MULTISPECIES: hypothetical protein [Providencia]EMB5786872.1 hypothetical protein [Providencia rettgeri]HBC7428417.1 hypothetical protein [Providencia rettgeri]
MDMPFLVNSAYLIDIQYANQKVYLTILLNGASETFIAYPKDGRIPVVSLSDELSTLLIQRMPHDNSISKKLFSLVWDYVKGKDVILPAKLL